MIKTTVYLTEEQDLRLETLIKNSKNISKSDFIRVAIENELNEMRLFNDKDILKYKLKKYVIGDWNENSPEFKSYLHNLFCYTSDFRYKYQQSLYAKEDRELFESSFIKYTYNKQLNREVVDNYIILSSEVVSCFRLQIQIQNLNNMLNGEIKEEDCRIKMGLIEAINIARRDYDESIKFQYKLMKELQYKNETNR